MKLFSGRLKAVALMAASAAVVLAAVPGTASAATGWRLAATFSKTGSLGTASASSTGNEWVAHASDTALFVEHRTASGWKQVPSPTLTLAPPDRIYEVQLVATSGSDAWAFVDVMNGDSGNPVYVVATQWTGSAWSASTKIADNGEFVAYAPSATDIWLFAGRVKSPVAWHHHGTSWVKYSLPWVVNAVGGNASAGLWIVGQGTGGAREVAHWAKGGWQLVPLPKSVPTGEFTFADSVVATSRNDVWAGLEYRPDFGPNFYGYLMHWDGTAWSRVTLPYKTFRPEQMASDGHGGLWVIPDPRFLFHYSGGHWTQQRVPGKTGYTAAISQLVAVPGSTSLLAAGGLSLKGVTPDGAIFTYGS